MSAPNLTSEFARHFAELDLEGIPIRIRQLGRDLLLDTLGCMVAGARTELAPQIRQIGRLFAGPGRTVEVGCPEAKGAANAVYTNARLGNLLDFDETYPVGVHFGVGAVAGALAGAQVNQGTFGDLLNAAIVGYEVGGRMASAIGPMLRVEGGAVTGFSRVWGVAAPVVLAASAAYGRALQLDSEQFHRAISIAGSNIPLPIGSKWSDAVDLPDVKYCDAGWCAVAGIHGVESARAGLTGFADILEGDFAIPQAYGAAMPDATFLHEELGARWHIEDITFKPWPTCRFMHPAMSALAGLQRRHGIRPDDLSEIVVHTGPLANSARFRLRDPRTFSGYQFSYAHACAMMVLGVPPGPAWFDPANSESLEARRFRKLVRVELFAPSADFASHMVNNQIRQMPGAVEIVTKAARFEADRDYADGDPWSSESQYSQAQITAKFLAANPGRAAAPVPDWLYGASSEQSIDGLLPFLRGDRHE